MIDAIRNEEAVLRLAAGIDSSKNLVFIRCGRDTALAEALTVPLRDFDLVVSLYEPAPAQSELIASGASIYAGGLSKFHAAQRIEQKYHVLSRYEYVLFLDGDLGIDAVSVQRLFLLAAHHRLDLCQASLTPDSLSGWSRFLTHDPRAARPRRSNYIEVMGPCFSRQALALCLPTFDRSISTWGLDFLWPYLLGYRNLAIVDAVQMRHIGLPDQKNGAFYNYLRSIGVDHKQELSDLKKECPTQYHPGLQGAVLGWRAPYLRRKMRRLAAKLRRVAKPKASEVFISADSADASERTGTFKKIEPTK